MSKSEHPLVIELARVQYDLTAIKARVSEIQRQVAALNLPSPKRRNICPKCGIDARGEFKLAEHLYHSHGGPLPAHYLAAEQAASEYAKTHEMSQAPVTSGGKTDSASTEEAA